MINSNLMIVIDKYKFKFGIGLFLVFVVFVSVMSVFELFGNQLLGSLYMEINFNLNYLNYELFNNFDYNF